MSEQLDDLTLTHYMQAVSDLYKRLEATEHALAAAEAEREQREEHWRSRTEAAELRWERYKEAAEQRLATVTAALYRYGDHDGECPAVAPVPQAKLDAFATHDERMEYLQSLIDGCNCGFDAALAAITPKKEEESHAANT